MLNQTNARIYEEYYDWKIVAGRIKSLRKDAGYSQDDLSYALEKAGYPVSPHTISRIETGQNTSYDWALLFYLCKVFDCDIGYLFGEYDSKTRESSDISDVLGISEEAIIQLKTIKLDRCNPALPKILELLILSDKFRELLFLLGYVTKEDLDNSLHGNVIIEISDREAINKNITKTIIHIAESIRDSIMPKQYQLFRLPKYRKNQTSVSKYAK